MTTNSEDYSDDEIRQLLHSVIVKNLIPYQNYHANQVIKFSSSQSIKKLILLRIFSSELWEEICNGFSVCFGFLITGTD